MTQRVIEITSPAFADIHSLGRDYDLNQLFPVRQPLALEIGCGIGDFIVQRAAEQPQVNFIAIDIFNKGCYKTCRRVDRSGLSNVRVMRVEARQLLSYCGRADMLSAVYINCPDPWPKKRHRNRRLLNRTFLTQLLYYLQPEGELFFVTDFADYAYQVAQLFPAVAGYENMLPAPFFTEMDDYPLSKYMRKFRDQGLPLYFQHQRRRADFTLRESELPPTDKGFRTRHLLE